jgi:hypothetical protein
VHSGPFSCLTKLYTKRAELVQKLVPRSRVLIFRKERTRSTPLEPKRCFAAFPTIWVHSRPFGCLTKLGAKRAELVQKFVPRSRIRIFRNEHPRSTPLDPKLAFWCVSYYLGAFGTVWLPYETRPKRAELVLKFVPRSRIGIFRNERTQFIPLDPKLCVSYYLGVFWTVWLPYETLCQAGRSSAKVSATK